MILVFFFRLADQACATWAGSLSFFVLVATKNRKERKGKENGKGCLWSTWPDNMSNKTLFTLWAIVNLYR